MKKNNIHPVLIWVTLPLLLLSLLYIHYSNLSEKDVSNLIVFVANMKDGPVKDSLVAFVRKNIFPKYVVPSINLIDDYYDIKHANASELVINYFYHSPLQSNIYNTLAENINHKDPAVRWRIIKVLMNNPYPGVYELILDRAKNDKDSDTRNHAIYCLGLVGDPRAKDFLLNELKNGTVESKYQASIALNILLGSKIAVDEQLEGWLSNYVGDTNIDGSLRSNIMNFLLFIPDNKAMIIACRLLNDKSRDVRKQAIFIIGEIGSKQDINRLTSFLNDKDPEIAYETKMAIYYINNRHNRSHPDDSLK